MRIASVEAFGVCRTLAEAWERVYGPELLPVQERALRAGVCAGESVVVVAPTGAGKTLVGEMAAAEAALSGRRAVYTVPTRALADEKYEAFSRTYEPLGLRVCVSTRDWRSQDRRIGRGDFDLLVTVNEKLRALLARHRELWRQVGLVVADEVQTINDRERGLCLELLLTELRVMGSGDSAAVDGTQVVALSATVPEAERLADWLRATLIADDRRPVELRMGVLCGGDFRWRACGPQGEGATGPEGLRGGEGASWEEAVEQAAAELIAEGEPTLVFVRDRRTAARLALGISGRGVAEPAREAQERLADGEATAGQAELLEALEGGTAFHHAGMSREERTVALEAFRGGEALGMVATSTLALGVNLPARNVIVDPFRWDTDVGGRPVCRWLSASEYENMAGRAGRPGLAGRAPDPFGRGILVATKALQAEAYWRRFIEGAAEPEVAAGGWEEEAVVQLAGIASRHGALSVPEVCAQTWRGARGDRAERERQAERLQELAGQCAAAGLLAARGQTASWEPTDLGEVCATRGVSVATVAWLRRWAEAGLEEPLSPFEMLLVAALAEDASSGLSLPGRRGEAVDMAARAEALADRLGDSVSGRAEALLSEARDQARAMRMVAAAVLWVGPSEMAEIEEETGCPAGTVAEVGETLAWLVEALGAIGKGVGWEPDQVAAAEELAERLSAGATTDLLGLVSLRREGLDRSHLRRLAEAGYETAEEVLRSEAEELAKALPPRVVSRLRRRAAQADEQAPEPKAPELQAPANAPLTLVFEPERPDLVTLGGHAVRLPPMQRRFLAALAERAGRCVSYRALARALWGEREADVIDPRDRLQTLAAKLRSCLGAAVPAEAGSIVQNVHMKGYLLKMPPVAVVGAAEALGEA